MNDEYYETIQIQARHIKAQKATIEALSGDIADINTARLAERAAWQASLTSANGKAEKLEKNNKKLARPWAVGLFGGWDAIHQEGVVGVGIVYSLIRF